MGGKVLLSEGTFTITTAIALATRTHLEGMGRSSIIAIADSADVNGIIAAAGAVDVAVSHLTLEGNKANNTVGDGVNMANLTSGLFCLDVAVNEFFGDGFGGANFTDGKYVACIADGNGNRGFVLLGTNERVVFEGCAAINNQIGFSPDISTDIFLLGCLAKDNVNFGFDIWRATRNVVIGCAAIDNGGIGLREFNGAPGIGFNVITNNTFDGNVGAAITRGYANSIIRDNIGHITEASGTATLLNGQVTIVVTHGLAVTPAAGDIMVTPMESLGAASEFYVDTYTATQFTIHVDVDPTQDVDFAWRAAVL